MKILVYGAGVLGCNLARNLLRAGKDVTLLARGNWAAEIKQNACTIYQNFHSLPPNPIFTICIFIPLSPTLARNRKKPLTEGSFKSLYPSI